METLLLWAILALDAAKEYFAAIMVGGMAIFYCGHWVEFVVKFIKDQKETWKNKKKKCIVIFIVLALFHAFPAIYYFTECKHLIA